MIRLLGLSAVAVSLAGFSAGLRLRATGRDRAAAGVELAALVACTAVVLASVVLVLLSNGTAT